MNSYYIFIVVKILSPDLYLKNINVNMLLFPILNYEPVRFIFNRKRIYFISI